MGCDLRLLMKTHGRGKPAQVASLVRQGWRLKDIEL
jgi:hypothetical protein